MICAVLISMLIAETMGSMSPAFVNWVAATYSQQTADRLNRADLGPGGSFGGGDHIPREKTMHEPVIIVHGISNRVDRFGMVRAHFLANGYTDAEIYGTTYGDAGKTSILFVSMECDYVKSVRELIIAASAYTNSTVDVLAYSMGSPIARKAILGGMCVDTGEELGEPLTHLVDTFVGVAGANFGSFLCLFPFGSCNLNNGMHCHSRFLAQINSKTRYEGAYIFTIYSTHDDKVGHKACGALASPIKDQNAGFEKTGLNHDQLMESTVATQFNLVTVHHE